MQRLGIDVGGSGIKGALVDVADGTLVSERERIPTPEGFGFDDVVDTIAILVERFDYRGPLGVGFPAVVVRGIVKSPPTADEYEGWVGQDLAAAVTTATGNDVTVMNDADAAGMAVYAFGAARGREGVVMVFTLGTGVGSAMFVDGILVPNTELGKLYLANHRHVAEHYVASRVRTAEDLSWDEWGTRLNEYFEHVDRLFTPDLVVIGGGVSRKHKRFLRHIDIRADVVPAELRNEAGIVGAATATLATHPV